MLYRTFKRRINTKYVAGRLVLSQLSMIYWESAVSIFIALYIPFCYLLALVVAEKITMRFFLLGSRTASRCNR